MKWRTILYALGTVELQVEDTIRRTSVVEVMDTIQRTAFSFGTIDFGEREKLVAIAKIVDRNGNTVGENENEGEIEEETMTLL